MRKRISFVVLAMAAAALLYLSSCARSQRLVGITVSPSAFTFFAPLAPGSQPNPIQLTALGTYIHPPETKDITTLVTWTSDQATVADISSAGVLTAGSSCGVANVSASFYTDGNKSGNVVAGTMTVTVDGPASQGCPTGTATSILVVDVTSGADGVITSTPAGINCGSTCSAVFPTGSTVTLTAAPISPHTFGAWGGSCTNPSGNTCTVPMNASTVTVTASFN